MAKKEKEIKTNAMRILDKLKIKYEATAYECDEFVDGKQTADKLGMDHRIVFKTLVTVSPKKEYFVFVLPIDEELDLKKCAKAAGVKSLAMIHVKEINSVTGYVRGSTTAIGMKKNYPVFLYESALEHETMAVSGGKIGLQLRLAPQDYIKASNATVCDFIA